MHAKITNKVSDIVIKSEKPTYADKVKFIKRRCKILCQEWLIIKIKSIMDIKILSLTRKIIGRLREFLAHKYSITFYLKKIN